MKRKATRTLKSKKGQQLNQRETALINQHDVVGFLLFNVSFSRGIYRLEYDQEGLVPLSEFLQNTVLSKRMFATMLTDILETVKSAEINHFSKQLISFSLNDVMIEPESLRIYFMYIPLQPYEALGTIHDMFKNFLGCAVFDECENLQYVVRFSEIVNAGTVCSLFAVEEYKNRILSEEKPITCSNETVICPQCRKTVSGQERICPFCGTSFQKTDTANRKKGDAFCRVPSIKSVQNNFLDNSPEKRKSGDFIINEDTKGNITVFRGSQNNAVWLQSCRDSSRIYMKKFPFRIGKIAEGTDYCISKGTVSRKHVDFLKEGDSVYIVDLHSTNGTWVDGKKIESGLKVKIENNSRIRMAEEEYILHKR